MPRRQIKCVPITSEKKSIISHFFSPVTCVVCGSQAQQGLCEVCKKQPQTTVIMLLDKVQFCEKKFREVYLVNINVLEH